MDDFDIVIIGSGPAGLFAAMELERLGLHRIAIVDRQPYPAGGLLNDGKLNFDYRIGIDLEELQTDRHSAESIMEEIRQVFIRLTACRQVTFLDGNTRIEALEAIAKEHGAQFIAPEQWHWGTDNGKAIVDSLRGSFVKTRLLLGTTVTSIARETDNSFRVSCVHRHKPVSYVTKVVLAAPGRSGAYWFRDVATKLGVHHNFGPIDVGIRVELNRRFYDGVTNVVYDPKFIFHTSRHGDKVRTFCTNPGGRVRPEDYYQFKLVNGDALSRRKTGNTNFALINTISLTEPYSDTTEFGQMIAKQCFLLGGGKPIVQRVGDFREGRRSSTSTFDSESRHFGVCRPTYRATPGDIALGFPARIIDNLWESLKTIDKIVPGILHPSTLLYAPEIKFFDTHFITDKFLETNIAGVFVAGDGAGKSRGIVGAAISGVIAARGIEGKHF
jgi:uncharacterized protein